MWSSNRRHLLETVEQIRFVNTFNVGALLAKTAQVVQALLTRSSQATPLQIFDLFNSHLDGMSVKWVISGGANTRS